MTRDHARKKAIRAQMAASGEPYSVAARKLEGAEPADNAARAEVIALADATLAASGARLEMRKELAVTPPAAAEEDEDDEGLRPGPFMRLVARATEFVLDRTAPPEFRRRPDIAANPSAEGIIEPAARRFQVQAGTLAWAYVDGRHYFGRSGRYAVLSGEQLADGKPDLSAAFGDDPLELLMRLRSVTEARYAGDEILRGAQCRKFAVSDGTGEFTVWVDGKHIRQVKTVAPQTREWEFRPGMTFTFAFAAIVELWDFGLPSGSLDWTRFSPSTGLALPRDVSLYRPWACQCAANSASSLTVFGSMGRDTQVRLTK